MGVEIMKYRLNKDGTFDRRYKSASKENQKIIIRNRNIALLNKKLIQNERRRKHIKFMKKVLFILTIMMLVMIGIWYLTEQMIKNQPEKTVISPMVMVAEAEQVEEPKELTTEEIICSYDWDCEDALEIVKCESNFNQYAINLNTNGTYDLGIWQINDIHGISRGDRFDINRATAFAYKIYQNRGNNFSAWTCAGLKGIN